MVQISKAVTTPVLAVVGAIVAMTVLGVVIRPFSAAVHTFLLSLNFPLDTAGTNTSTTGIYAILDPASSSGIYGLLLFGLGIGAVIYWIASMFKGSSKSN